MVDVNESFGLGQNAIGVNTGVLGVVYTPLTSGVSTIALAGSFTNPGDTVTANIDTAGIVAANATASYSGFSQNMDGHHLAEHEPGWKDDTLVTLQWVNFGDLALEVDRALGDARRPYETRRDRR